ncbi:MAG: 16S rRNA (guanine(966)-N(2))-methyltransferase RsmD [Oscillospiraceae bacterium]|nr:16S rRNA (guanine(966)-N(2))-methyltransferase RsmD [Oscillospiraceae bacterium]
MKVITGTARGMRLQTLPGEDTVRPTSQRVKEAMFSAIQFEIEGRQVLDAFAGCGQLGIEALSRGAAHCLFLEQDSRAQKIVQENLAHTRFDDQAKLMPVDAVQYIRRTNEQFGVIFLDPPFGSGMLQEVLPLAAERLTAGGLIICEAPVDEALPELMGDVALRRSYRHGRTKVCVFQKGEVL